MRIRKSRCIESDGTHCYTRKFNVAFSLCRVLGVALYFSKSFLETTTGVSVVAEAPWPLVTVVCFLEQKSSLWSPASQQRHRLFLRRFLHSSLVNLPLLSSLEAQKRDLSTEYWVASWEQWMEMTWRKSSWWVRPPEIDLPCSGKLWQYWRQKLFLASRSET